MKTFSVLLFTFCLAATILLMVYAAYLVHPALALFVCVLYFMIFCIVFVGSGE